MTSWSRDLQAAGVPCAPVKSIREVDTDEHLIQRGMIHYVEHPARGRVPVAGMPAAPQRLAGRTAAGRPAAGPVDRRRVLAELSRDGRAHHVVHA